MTDTLKEIENQLKDINNTLHELKEVYKAAHTPIFYYPANSPNVEDLIDELRKAKPGELIPLTDFEFKLMNTIKRI